MAVHGSSKMVVRVISHSLLLMRGTGDMCAPRSGKERGLLKPFNGGMYSMLLKPYYPVSDPNMRFSLSYFGCAPDLSPSRRPLSCCLDPQFNFPWEASAEGRGPKHKFPIPSSHFRPINHGLKHQTIWHHPYLFCLHEKLPPSCVILSC